MNIGVQLTFYTQAERSFENQPLYEWLVKQAKLHGIDGITVINGFEGIGHDGQTHLVNWFDPSQQPIRIIMVLEEDKSENFLKDLAHCQLNVFYTVSPVQYGFI